jgi:two-component system, sensor histidine kinase PdtaS
MAKPGLEELEELKRKLERAEERYETLFELHPDPMIATDMDGIILAVNRSFCDRSGYSADRVVGRAPEDGPLMRGLDRGRREAFLRDLGKPGAVFAFEAEYARADGARVPCEVTGRIVEAYGRRMTVSVIRDLSEEKAAERMMLESERLYQETFNQSPAVKLLIDPESLRIIDANAAAAAFYGYPVHRLRAMGLVDINTAPESEIRANFSLAAAEAQSRFVYRHRLASGEIRDVEAYAGLIDLGGRKVLHSIIHDITDKVRAEEELKRLVAEKETLMKELQHRVKNNLGVVAGLLSLSAEKVRDAEAREAFAGAIARVDSIAAIYAKLYGTKDLASIDLGPYSEDLARSLFGTYNLDPERITLTTRFDSARLDLKRCAPYGLILNELVTNALKYAYPDGERGEVRVELKAEDDRIELSVADDGPGIPEAALSGGSSGLGMTLVRMLAAQLGASVEIEGSRGARVRIAFQA